MNPPSTITYNRRDEIDDNLWNECIKSATNSLVYGHSIYLDEMAYQWHALVLGNYEAVMPLCWKEKFGITYLYQPFVTAQLGVFGQNVSSDIVLSFLNSIPRKFRLWEFPMNYENKINSSLYKSIVRKNYVLDLNVPYHTLLAGYRPNTLRNISKAKRSMYEVRVDIAYQDIITLAKHGKGFRERENLERLYQLCTWMNDLEMISCYGIQNRQGKLLSVAIFFVDCHRAYYILPWNDLQSRDSGSSHLLIDKFIEHHSGKDLILDFEGSDVPGLQFFYSGFGAKEENYPMIFYNKLPWPVRLFK